MIRILEQLAYGYRTSKWWRYARVKNKSIIIRNFRKMFIYCFIGIIAVILQCALMIAFAHIPVPNLEWYHKTGIYSIFIAPIFVNGFVECQYVIYTTMLKNRYAILNEYLTTMIENSNINNNLKTKREGK